MTDTRLFTGYKAVTLDDLPEEAWTIVTGGGKDTRASTLYGLVGWLHRCVDIRASSLATMPWTIKRGETVLLTNDDDITPEFKWMETLPDLLYRTEAATTLTGRSYWFRERNRVKTLGLRWLHPLSVRPEINERDGLTHFTRTLGDGVEKRFELEDIIYLWVPDPFVEIGPAEHFPGKAALQAAGILSNMDEFLASYFARGLIKATLLTKMPTPGLTTGPQKTSDDERSRVLEWWRRATGGIKNANVTEMATGDFRPIVVGEGLQDLQNTSLTTEQRESIATALGVPHSKVTANAANFATANQDARSFVTDTMIPETRWIGAELNRQIFAPMGLQFDFRPESLAIMQDDEAQRAASLEALVRAGMSLEAAVRILGYDLPQDVPLRDVADSAPVSIQPQPRSLPDSDLEAERRRFTRWAKRRKSPDVDDFDSDLLSREDKLALLGGGSASDAPFRDWQGYP